MYLRALMYLAPLLLGVLTLVSLGVPASWWWVLAVPYLVAGVLGAIGAMVDAALARMVEQEAESTDR